MAHFAQIDDNSTVTRVIVVDNKDILDEHGNESEEAGIRYCQNLLGGTWMQTSFNNRIRKNYAGVGYVYNEQLDAFIQPSPFPSWVLNEQVFYYEAPVPKPIFTEEDIIDTKWDEGNGEWRDLYPSVRWDEPTLNWIVGE